jgi:hypothetical protein
MKAVWVVLLAGGLGGCVIETPSSPTVLGVHQSHDWQHEPGAELQGAMTDAVVLISGKHGRAETLVQLREAGYACQYGEAHADYPEPMAVCTRSFATRACQFDWQVALTSDPARPDGVETIEAEFKRDCVATADDWPEAVASPIDDQLAPAPEITDTY